jgi:hypothetical protein
LASFGQLWPALASFGQFWPALASFGHFCHVACQSKQHLHQHASHLDMFLLIQTHGGSTRKARLLSCQVCINLAGFGQFCHVACQLSSTCTSMHLFLKRIFIYRHMVVAPTKPHLLSCQDCINLAGFNRLLSPPGEVTSLQHHASHLDNCYAQPEAGHARDATLTAMPARPSWFGQFGQFDQSDFWSVLAGLGAFPTRWHHYATHPDDCFCSALKEVMHAMPRLLPCRPGQAGLARLTSLTTFGRFWPVWPLSPLAGTITHLILTIVFALHRRRSCTRCPAYCHVDQARLVWPV